MFGEKWSVERANAWYERQPWLVGCNFIPSSAINQLEMWQPETFDPETITRELGWAAALGFNTIRVGLHDLLWAADAQGFKNRIDRFLGIAAKHRLRVTFVMLDDCWNTNPHLGPQPEPRPGVHGSGGVQSPGIDVVRNPREWSRLEDYLCDTVGTFGADERVVIWDIYNEPGNYFMTAFFLPPVQRTLKQLALLIPHLILPIPSLRLLHRAFAWARSCNPSQPLTAGLWYLKRGFPSRINSVLVELSDVITFHEYYDLANTVKIVAELKTYNRPLICTEYLARTHNNLFSTHLPFFKQQKIGAYNWGLVAGKTQTIYGWGDAGRVDEPKVWYHDIFRPNGTPYDPAETAFIRQITDVPIPNQGS